MSTKIPKIMNFFWDKSSLSYLQLLTITSFNKFNPDWRIIIHEPEYLFKMNTWLSGEQKIPYIGKNYYSELRRLPYVEFKEVDFESIGFKRNVSSVIKSDYLRWKLLSTEGGGWSDMDILYIKPITHLKCDNNIDTVICYSTYGHIIGFFLASKNNDFFKITEEEINSNYDKSEYQSLGATLLNGLNRNMKGDNILNLVRHVLYPYDYTKVNMLFNENDLHRISVNTIGVHWYNGSHISREFNNWRVNI